MSTKQDNTSTKESLSALRGVPAITSDDGADIGIVQHIYLDPESRRLSALGIKARHGGDSLYVEASDITLIGRDVFLLSSEEVAKPMSEDHQLGRRLRKLRGLPVITDSGRQLGTLVDFDINREGFLQQLHLSEHRTIAVVPQEVTLGTDAIVLPAAYADKVVEAPDEAGLFARVRSWTHRVTEEMRGNHDESN